MKPRCAWLGWLGLAVATVFVAGCAGRLPIDKDWIEAKTEHFTIMSAMSERQTSELARELEAFRAGVLRLTNVESLDSPVPTRIFFFDSSVSFEAFSSRDNIVGFFMPTIRANYVAIVNVPKVQTDRILKHEYVHFLMSSGRPRAHPYWYNEGFAELLSTIQIRDEHMVVGGLPEDRILQLRFTPWIPLHRIMEYDGTQPWEPSEIAMFYAESWALVHYLTRNHEMRVSMTKAMKTYTDNIRQGVPRREASKAAFGKTTAELDGALRGYLHGGSFSAFGIPMDRLDWSPETRLRSVPRAEAAERLGELALFAGRTTSAQALFEAALAEDPNNARANAGLGTVLARAKLWSEARGHLELALELSPEDPLNELDLGQNWQARAVDTEDADQRSDMMSTARLHYNRAAELDDGLVEAYSSYGASYLVRGEDPRKGIKVLEYAAARVPADVETQLSLARAYAAIGREEDARSILRGILVWAHKENGASSAQELLEQLESNGGAGTD